MGRATALDLAARGCSVLINYTKSEEDALATVDDLRALGVKSVAVKCDVADDVAVREMVAVAEREFGRLDVLVNNAGTTVFVPHSDLDALSDDDWLRVYAVNTLGPFHCVRAAKPVMDRSGGGEIVNVSSVAGVAGVGSSIPYCASKAALNNLTVTLARVCAPTIRVNAVAPGFITGRWLQGGLGDEIYEAVKQHYEGTNPLQAVCSPEDVAAAIVSLIAGSDLVTGQVVVVDGGQLIRG